MRPKLVLRADVGLNPGDYELVEYVLKINFCEGLLC